MKYLIGAAVSFACLGTAMAADYPVRGQYEGEPSILTVYYNGHRHAVLNAYGYAPERDSQKYIYVNGFKYPLDPTLTNNGDPLYIGCQYPWLSPFTCPGAGGNQ